MPTRDKFHQECRVALEKDGWTITHDFVLSFLIHKHKALYNGKNEKIWLQENNSDIRIALDLEQKGVPKSEIVLGIHAPSLRSYSDYAAA